MKIKLNFPIVYMLALTVIVLSSCEDKIDVTLDEVDPIVVIDAWITDEPGKVQEIFVTHTQSYFDSNTPPGITNAEVGIATGGDIILPFDHVGEGRYIWDPNDNNLSIADIGSSFELSVFVDDVTYTATDVLKRSPEIEEIRQEIRVNELGSVDGGIYCEFIARDFLGLGDTYWIKSYKNGVYLNKPEEINIAYEAGFDVGADSDGLVFIPPIRELTNPVPDSIEIADDISPWAPGDICRVEIHSISNSAFDFMERMRDQILNGNNGIFAEPLANSPSNIESSDDSKVLGVFNVATVKSKEIVVQ